MSSDKNLPKQLHNNLVEYIEMFARRAGFDLFGVVPIGEMKTEINALDDWASKKYYGDMNWFANSLEKRKDIFKVMPGAKSVICVALNYYPGKHAKNVGENRLDTFSRYSVKKYPIKNEIKNNIKNKKDDGYGDGYDDDGYGHGESVGQIARYAYGRDYHKIFDKKLKLFVQKLREIFPGNDFTPPLEANKYATKNNKFYSNIREPRVGFKYYSDTGPILERAWAVRAGLGFIGKNTNLITKYGSWVLLGEVITNVSISNELLAVNHSKNKYLNACGNCHRCLDACPTGALCAPYTVDARKCISYLTIEHKGEIPLELREKMGNRIFGCDACQEVCPFNIGRQKPAENEMTQKAIAGSARDLKEILSIKTDKEFLEKISPPFQRTARSARHEDCNHQEKSSKQSIANIAEETKMSARRAGFAGSPVMRAKRIGLVRNACIAAGNSGDKALLPYLKKCSNDEDEIIASHARWAIEILETGK